MEITAKRMEPQPQFIPQVMGNFELMTTEIRQDVKGNDVELPLSLGVYNKGQLQGQIEQLTKQIAELQSKLDAIAKLEEIK